MPLGFSKKDREESSTRASLFGKRSKDTKSPAPSANPYAVPAATPDPYAGSKPANPYDNKVQSGYTPQQLGAPPAYDTRAPSPQRQDKTPVPPGGYAAGPQQARFPTGGSYAQQSGYGNNAYDGQPSQSSRPTIGGYGGLGRSNSQDTMATDVGRAALFGDAPQRLQQQQQQQQVALEEPSATADHSYSGSSGAGYPADLGTGGYYGSDTHRTEEEQEEEDVQAAKNEIKFIKQQDVSSTRNALRIAEQAEATGRETLARLGAQGDRIHNTERNLDLASHQNRLAQEKASELKTLNRSMFAVHMSNPFTAKKREEARLAIELDKHQRERDQSDATRSAAYSTTQRHAQQGRDFRPGRAPTDKASLAQRAKFQFEADSEDDEMENEIDGNLEAIHKGARTLNMLGRAMGEELDEQNQHIGRILNKTDQVDDQIALNRARLNRIR